jgi:predicted type IV restriction endonuclease
MEETARVFDESVPSANEAQTEQDLVRPALALLGHDFEVQPALKTPDGTKRPDYVFYCDAAALAANKGRTLDDGLLREKAFAVGDA